MPEPADFIFTEEMIREAKRQKEGTKKTKGIKESFKTTKGRNAFHSSLKKSSDFVFLAWDCWLLMAPYLRNELQKRCPEKTLNKKTPFFMLKHIDKAFELHILESWVAKKLRLPKKYLFKQDDPLEMYKEIIYKFLGD